MSRTELNTRNLHHVLASLGSYLRDGGALSIETRHGEAAHDNEIAFRVADWDAFVLALEPGAGVPSDTLANGTASEAARDTPR